MLCWEVIRWSSPYHASPCLSPHYYCLHKLVVSSTQHTHTHSTRCTCTHMYTWYISHSRSAHIEFYLPPTDYTCGYQTDALGTDCWKTLECRNGGMIIPHTTDHTILHTYKALSLWYYNHWSQQQCWLQSRHSIPVLGPSHWLPAVSHSDLLTKWYLFQDQLVDSFFFVCSCRSLCMLSKTLCFAPVIVDSKLKLQWSQ